MTTETSTTTTVDDVCFESAGTMCAAWHLRGAGDSYTGLRGRPCAVMAHGFAGTRDSGLLGYAEGFAAAGLDVLLFDYRGFGASEGAPRQLVSYRRQRRDYHAAIAFARLLDGVDPERIVLWGTSYAGGHVVAVAARDRRVVAAIAVTPAMDGAATLVHLGRTTGVGQLMRAMANGLRDAGHALLRRAPHTVPVVGPRGSAAILGIDRAEARCLATAGPTWRNEVCARTALTVALNRPTIYARRLACPLLIQIGDEDRAVPPSAERRAAAKAAAEVRAYPFDHFDAYDGHWQRCVLADQLDFLRRRLTSTIEEKTI